MAENREKWYASIKLDGKVKYLGYFDNQVDAALSYDQAAIRLFGGFARTNIIGREPGWEADFGLPLPTIELSGHAIDNASLRVRKIWHETKRDDDEGLYTWLMRMVVEAMQAGQPIDGAYFYNGMKLVVQQGEEFPVLKTVMRKKGRPEPEATTRG